MNFSMSINRKRSKCDLHILLVSDYVPSAVRLAERTRMYIFDRHCLLHANEKQFVKMFLDAYKYYLAQLAVSIMPYKNGIVKSK